MQYKSLRINFNSARWICAEFGADFVTHLRCISSGKSCPHSFSFSQMLQVNILKSRLPGSNSSGNSGNSNSQPEVGHNSHPAQQHQDDTFFEENEKVLQEYNLTAECSRLNIRENHTKQPFKETAAQYFFFIRFCCESVSPLSLIFAFAYR